MKKSIHFILAIVITLFLSSSNVAATEISITENGSGSSNEAIVTQTTQTTVEQNNEATVENSVASNAESGNNEANANTGDQTNIQSGSVESNVTIENNVNNSKLDQNCCITPSPTPNTITITGNGANSTNSVNGAQTTSTTVSVVNNATITNTIKGVANSGGNKANNNNADVTIQTGKVTVTENVKNTLNTSHIQFSTQSNNEFNMKISGNGTGAVTLINVNKANTIQIRNTQNADILTISNWFANSGNNTASGNIGDVIIKTGDVSISTIINNVINSSTVKIECCKTETPPPPPCKENCGGPENPQTPNNPASPSSGGSGGSSSGSGSSSGGNTYGSVLGITSGEILPATGSAWTLWLTILAGLLFALGFFLRMHPGRAPNRNLAI